MDSEGLLLLTDDGELNSRISDPKNKQFKTYLVQVEGVPREEALEKLRKGLSIQGKKTFPASASVLSEEPKLWPRPKPIRYRKKIPTSWLLVKIREGRNHQVKKMTAAVGFPCLRLVRTAIGGIVLDGLQPGEYKEIEKPSLTPSL